MITKIFNGFMVCIYLGIGVYFLFFQKENPNFSLVSIRTFGTVLTIYGVFRAYRFYKSLKIKEYESEAE
jgi:hypothetical protein